MKRILLTLFLMIFPVFSYADEKKQAEVTAQIEKYINQIKTIKSRFVQLNPDGKILEGLFTVQKPNKMRLVYDEPITFEFVADGYYLIYHDKHLDQLTHFDLEDNPVSIILKDDFSFEKDNLKVEGIDEYNNLIAITVSKKDQMGKITLYFSKVPYELKQWRVVDPQGAIITVTLNNPEFNVEVDQTLFKLKKKD